MSRICRQRLCVFVRFLTQSIRLSVALRFLSSLRDYVLVFRPLKVLSTYISFHFKVLPPHQGSKQHSHGSYWNHVGINMDWRHGHIENDPGASHW